MTRSNGKMIGSPGLRLIKLFLLLSSTEKSYSLTRLANLLSCSRQTVLRMMDQLNRIPDVQCISSRTSKERIFQVKHTKSERIQDLSPDALRIMFLCRDIVHHLLPEDFQKELQQALHVVTTNSGTPDIAPVAIAEPWSKGHIDYSPYKDILEDIATALHARRSCRIKYRSRSRNCDETFSAIPQRLVNYRESFYLKCHEFDQRRQELGTPRTLAIQRIKSLKLEGPVQVELPEENRDDLFGFPVHTPIRVKVLFHGRAAEYVAERVWSKDQKIRQRKDGSLVLTFSSTSRQEVISWVLSFGPDAELMEPKDLREEMKEKAKSIMERYTQQMK